VKEIKDLVERGAAERKPLFGNPDAYRWGSIANPRDRKPGPRPRRGDYSQLTVKEYLYPVTDAHFEYLDAYLESWERLCRGSRLLVHMRSQGNVILVTTRIDPRSQLLSDWGPGKPTKECLAVLDQVIVYLSALMKNCLARSHKELRPGNIFVRKSDFLVEIGFPLLPGISLKLMKDDEKRFIAPEVLKYQQMWDDSSFNTDSSRDDDSSTDGDAHPDGGPPPNGSNLDNWTHSCPKADVFSFGQLAVFLLGGNIEMIEQPLAEALRDRAQARELVTLLRKCGVENERQRNVDLTELVTRWRKICSYAPGLALDAGVR
jgi:hypothetical protein